MNNLKLFLIFALSSNFAINACNNDDNAYKQRNAEYRKSVETAYQEMKNFVTFIESEQDINEENITSIFGKEEQVIKTTIELTKDLRADKKLLDCYKLNLKVMEIQLEDKEDANEQLGQLLSEIQPCAQLIYEYTASKEAVKNQSN